MRFNYKYERTLFVAILAIIAFVIVIIFRPYPDDYKHNYTKFWLKKTINTKKYDVVIIGDSRVYRGLSPKIISDGIGGLSVLNFGYSSARLNKFMFSQAEKRLDKESDNKIIIIGVTPNSLIASSNENDHYLEFSNMPREEQLEVLYFYDFLKLFAPIRKKDFKRTKQGNKPNYVQEFEPNGWIASNKIPEDTTEAFDSYTKFFSVNKVSNEMIRGFCLQTKLWVEKGILVYAFRFPTSEGMKNIEDSLSGFNEELLSEEFADAGGKWLEIDTNYYHSYDGSHLDKHSAIILSQKLSFYMSCK